MDSVESFKKAINSLEQSIRASIDAEMEETLREFHASRRETEINKLNDEIASLGRDLTTMTTMVVADLSELFLIGIFV